MASRPGDHHESSSLGLGKGVRGIGVSFRLPCCRRRCYSLRTLELRSMSNDRSQPTQSPAPHPTQTGRADNRSCDPTRLKQVVEETPRHLADAVAKAAALDPDRVHAVTLGADRHELHCTRLKYGGRKWRFTCGRCGRKVRWLYAPDDTDRSGCQACCQLGWRCNTRSRWRRDRWTREQRAIVAALERETGGAKKSKRPGTRETPSLNRTKI